MIPSNPNNPRGVKILNTTSDKRTAPLKWLSKVPIHNAPKGNTFVRGINAQKRLRKLAATMLIKGHTMSDVGDACARDIALILKHNPQANATTKARLNTLGQSVKAALAQG